MKSPFDFDYIIIGNGLAGLQLALALAEDSYFKNKRIALIDKSQKNTNDKTWCFWEKEHGKWDHLVSKSWCKTFIFSSNQKLQLNLAPYQYKSIRSIDLYNDAKTKLQSRDNFHFIIDNVLSTEEATKPLVTTSKSKYTASHIFDSRIPKDYFNKKNKYTIVNQHFKGWVIETETSVFNPEVFTMMDYRVKDNNQTTFTYVLPLSKNKALIEFTYFTPKIVKDHIYDHHLKLYISEILKIENYKIIEEESGNIPMTTFPFENYSSKNITKIGTGGGWVKGSTGYSFKHTEKKVAIIVSNLKQGKLITDRLFKKKYKFYDKIFLRVLHDNNEKGEWIFKQFYTNNSVETMFSFLDEDSSILDELKIMTSLFSISFIKAFFKTL